MNQCPECKIAQTKATESGCDVLLHCPHIKIVVEALNKEDQPIADQFTKMLRYKNELDQRQR